jgi:hemolysin activation/secretion protein
VAKASLTDWRSVGRQRDTQRLRDRLRVARFGFDFSNEGKTRFQGDLSISRGLGFDGMTRAGDPLASRPDASGRFTKAAVTVQLSRPLGERATLRAVGVVQYSDRPLLSAEEFSLGGTRVGRAFDFNAGTGDEGAGAGVELSYRLGKDGKTPSGLELFGFADAGVAKDLRSSLAPANTRSLASVGVGARFTLAHVTMSVETGVPLAGPRHSPRLFVSAFRSF